MFIVIQMRITALPHVCRYLKIFQIISSQNNCIKFQDDLNSLFLWCSRWGMSLRLPKCFIITYTNKFNKINPTQN
jgi:hypothetical protein